MTSDPNNLLHRGVDEIIGDLDAKLKLGRPLKIKAGFDPTAPDMHLGHVVLLRKLRHFQDLGHQVDFLIGDFTAMIGDPSGRNQTRPALTKEEVLANAQTYQDQVFKILDKSKTNVVFNSKWLDELGAAGMLRLAGQRTVARMLERDDFKKRFEENVEITIVEFLYPLLQGYDSVALESDVELGGSDQRFNLLMGRTLQERYDQPPQVILMLPLIEGTDGVRKMSKSYGNSVGIFDTPTDIFGKIMSIPDELIWRYMLLLTDISEDEIKNMESSGDNPRNAKARLGREVVAMLRDEEAAQKASDEFDAVFKNKGVPDEIPEAGIEGSEDLPTLLNRVGMSASKGEARRLIQQGGLRWEDSGNWTKIQSLEDCPGDGTFILKIGKKGKFLRVSR
ncbi:MAG: tyrosine--tRNA ligase [Candidatus Lindowbacteria bacterium]|nr:tyrosine--tRNA ligase [Candidatus Lindowbacteria bacterium]